jgi:hypothetical protein
MLKILTGGGILPVRVKYSPIEARILSHTDKNNP